MISDYSVERISKMSQMRKGLNRLFSQYNRVSAKRGKIVSDATQDARRHIIEQGFNYLIKYYDLSDVRRFRTKHMRALVEHWHSKNLSIGTIQNRLSAFRSFCHWIEKPGMTLPIEEFVRDPKRYRRTSATTIDKSWSTKGINIEKTLKKVAERDKRVALQMLLQLAFCLRPREAWLLRPVVADTGHSLNIYWGTKNGRKRVVPVSTPEQRNLLEIAKAYANCSSGSLIPSNMTIQQWRGHFYYICNLAGINRTNGLVPHGLRHEAANNIYEKLVGYCSPVRARTSGVQLHAIDRRVDRQARQYLSELLGHSREHITSAYIGSDITRDQKVYDRAERMGEKIFPINQYDRIVSKTTSKHTKNNNVKNDHLYPTSKVK